MSDAVPGQVPGRTDSWEGLRVVVLGVRAPGFAVADNLSHLGATVTLVDEHDPRTAGGPDAERARLLEMLGVTLLLGPGSSDRLPPADLLVVTLSAEECAGPAEQARQRGIPVCGEVELAWRLRDPGTAPPWLVLAGPASQTIPAAGLLAAMLRSGGHPAVVCGEVGLPVVEAVMDPSPYDVLVAVLDGTRLDRAGGMAAHSAAVLGAGDPAFGRAFAGVEVACVYRLEDPATEDLVRDADVVEGARAIGVTLGMPAVGTVGVVEDVLADRAFLAERRTSAAELGTLADLGSADPDVVVAALAAAALARAFGVESAAVRDGLRSHRA